ncbi:MAG: hypothetical protein EOO47_10645 [Flavobacterium sp.]|nr:MAG: hypothetical protein EOO47_10645 [Flavobacterium sp.]
MKNKKKTYLLLLLVIIIWGLLIYKFFSFRNDEIAETIPTQDFIVKPLKIEEKVLVLIDVNYRDPFLGKMYMPPSHTKKNTRKKKPLQKETIVWPEVVYKGIVSDNKDSKKVFMIIINGQTYLMSEKDTEQDVNLKGGNRKSISVTYKNILTTIFINE